MDMGGARSRRALVRTGDMNGAPADNARGECGEAGTGV